MSAVQMVLQSEHRRQGCLHCGPSPGYWRRREKKKKAVIHVHKSTCHCQMTCNVLDHSSELYMYTHYYVDVSRYACIYIQSLRQGKARQLHLKTTPLFPKRKKKRCLRWDSNPQHTCTCKSYSPIANAG